MENKNEWRKIKLGDILNFYNGKKINRKQKAKKYKIYGANGILGFGEEFFINKPSIILGRVGAYCGSVMFEKDFFWATDNTIVANSKENNDIKYLYYLLSILDLNKRASGSAQPLINQTLLKNIEVLIPNIYIQKKISKILSDIDEKIELNNKINDNLLFILLFIILYFLHQFLHSLI